jgi:hypothetical protein
MASDVARSGDGCPRDCRRWRRPIAPTCPSRICCCRRACADWLPEDHLAFFVSDLIDQLDLSAVTAVVKTENGATRRITR